MKGRSGTRDNRQCRFGTLNTIAELHLHTLHIIRIDDRRGSLIRAKSIVVTPTDFTVDRQRLGTETVAGEFGSVLQDEYAHLTSHRTFEK